MLNLALKECYGTSLSLVKSKTVDFEKVLPRPVLAVNPLLKMEPRLPASPFDIEGMIFNVSLSVIRGLVLTLLTSIRSDWCEFLASMCSH